MLPSAVRHAALSQSIRKSLPATLSRALDDGAPIDIHPQVLDALITRKPIVALESTIITHGMPHPTNLDTALSVERNVASTGAVPATIGLIGGRIKYGLERGELEYLADTTRESVKLSRRDLAAAMALKKDGGTTCSTTLILAALAGIKVFATGGLGGVHRGGENSMDVSADLLELSRSPVGLVSAGVKSILDIGRTLEYLETIGVPVFTYGKTNDFPAFYSRRSGFKSPWRLDDPQTAAQVLLTHDKLNINTGVLFGVPIPETYEAIGERIQEAVEQAVAESEANGMAKRGKEVTPWLLKRVGELTEGKSLASNVALIENTALVGGRIAVEHAKLVAEQDETRGSKNTYSVPGLDSSDSLPLPVTVPETPFTSPSTTATSTIISTSSASSPLPLPPAKLIVIGSAAIDITAQVSPTVDPTGTKGLYSTSPGRVSLSLGGVGRNVAEAAHRVLSSFSSTPSATNSESKESLEEATVLVSAVGKDSFGRLLVDEMGRMGMRTDGLLAGQSESEAEADDGRTAVCNMVLDGKGGLVGGVADMDIILSLKEKEVLDQLRKHNPLVVAVDANLSPVMLTSVVRHASENNLNVFFEPTSVLKSTAIMPAIASWLNIRANANIAPRSAPITFASPNLLELSALYNAARSEPYELTSHPHWWQTIDSFKLGSEFRFQLEQLARLPAAPVPHPGTVTGSTSDGKGESKSKQTLGFLVHEGVAQMAINLLPFFQNLIIKCGSIGVILVSRIPSSNSSSWTTEQKNVPRRTIILHGKSDTILLRHFPAHIIAEDSIVNVTGAGDTLVGALLAEVVRDPGLFEGKSSGGDGLEAMGAAVERAQGAAVKTLKSSLAVSPLLSVTGS